MKIDVDIRPTGIESAVVYAPFDKAQKALTEGGYEIISLPQNAQLRIQQGKSHNVSRNGNWVREGVLYVPGGKSKLVRNSPILLSAEKATQAYRSGREFYPPREQVESSLVDSIDFPNKTFEIPTNRFDSEALTIYAFGGEQEAKAYGEFLREGEAGIKSMTVYAIEKSYVDSQTQPFVRQMWFGSLDFRSELDGYDRDLSYDYRLRGVLKSGEASASKNGEKR